MLTGSIGLISSILVLFISCCYSNLFLRVLQDITFMKSRATQTLWHQQEMKILITFPEPWMLSWIYCALKLNKTHTDSEPSLQDIWKQSGTCYEDSAHGLHQGSDPAVWFFWVDSCVYHSSQGFWMNKKICALQSRTGAKGYNIAAFHRLEKIKTSWVPRSGFYMTIPDS